MSTNYVYGVLVYLIPVIILVAIGMCCVLWRENRRSRLTVINQQNVPIVNPIQQSSQDDNNTPPPPYSTQCPPNFEDSLPSYERAVNRLS